MQKDEKTGLTKKPARRQVKVPIPEGFSFRHAVQGHGWYDLAPFQFDEAALSLSYVFRDRKSGRPVAGTITESKGTLTVSLNGDADAKGILRDVKHILRFDEPLGKFYEISCDKPGIEWAARSKAGRLLRSATVFEDLVKTLCTTNCSWSLTRKMVTNLTDLLGDEAPCGARAFPTAEAMADVPAEFYREEIRAGYRAPYLHELAESVADARLDPEAWLTSDLPSSELKKEIKRVKGIGDYAADNLLKLLGRYDGLALDSWLRAGYYKKHNNGRKCTDKRIERHYAKYGEWRGLAIWCDMTERWFDDDSG
jgi:3-methyladenine DNA glycosylase/8-oxoguanine DNA glycosylase